MVKMDRKILYEKLDGLLNILKVVKEEYETIDTWANTRQFMDRLIDIYLALKTEPSIAQDAKFQDYLHESATELIWFTNYINNFMVEMEQTLNSTFYNDEWVGICWQRSAIEAIKEIYQNTCLEEYFTELDTEDLDECIAAKGEKEGYLTEQQIPSAIPSSHWWWWYPKTPSTSHVS
ncbi:hypothetical protein [Anabaena azotica]|uniref:Uncharacterized protein n=1 Tax=Anabaena azotica FACHB-119 TaxID=947527 RepID=A0ABR8D0W2_9NOST|nr:hypothetical protein [Anabaena azotica]MBD2500374.1 hypothetical protein [Anabaena azotica FACHB-119]